jgi:hypothetical protein
VLPSVRMVEPPRQPLWPWICKTYEVVSFDGKVLILKWINPEVAGRYGIMVLARCGSPPSYQ